MPTISVDADSASQVSQRYGVIVHGIYATGVGRAGRNAWEAQLGQSGIAKIADETGGEYYSLGTQNLVSFKPYLDRLQKVFDNQYYLVFEATPKKKAGLQRVNISTEEPGHRNCGCRQRLGPGRQSETSSGHYLEIRAMPENRMCRSWFRSGERRNYLLRSVGDGSTVKWRTKRRIVCVVAVLCGCVLAIPAGAQQQPLPEDPEDEKQIGLWLDQGISTGLSPNTSLEIESHERFDEGASNLFEYFVQGGVAFRLRPWFTLIPIYRYQRFPGNLRNCLRKPAAA